MPHETLRRSRQIFPFYAQEEVIYCEDNRRGEEGKLGLKRHFVCSDQNSEGKRLRHPAKMRLNFSASWIFRGWITCALLSLYAQDVVAKSVQCDDTHYVKGNRCCKKCGPGFRVMTHCSDSHQTKCIKCSSGEYQPGWTEEEQCLRQKFCDNMKGFMKRPENLVAEEPCRCLPHLQCYPVNCEFCERIPTCGAGYGLELDPEYSNGRKACVACKKGFFSAEESTDECKPWTSCKAEGRAEVQPGSAQADAVCGPHVSGASSSWVVVSLLSVIIVVCLLILLLFCYKDKLKLLSVNLRSCVQNLKRTRIQQETLAPHGYHSGGPKCSPCEITKLICQAPHSPTDQLPSPFPATDLEVKVSLPFTAEAVQTPATREDPRRSSGEPQEVSEEDEVEEGGTAGVSPLMACSCVCLVPVREPLEVGENEDCSQAVGPGTPGTCSCGGLDGDGKEGETGDGNQEKVVACGNETGAKSLVSLSSPLVLPPSGPLPELCLPLSQALGSPEFKPNVTDRSKHEALYRPGGEDSASAENSAVSSVSPLMTSSSLRDLYLDKAPEGADAGQGLFCEEAAAHKLSSGGAELQCSPESLHSQLAEPTLTSGQVSGNHNTTFISSGQVMNFSGDVIVVYVSQTSLGSEGAGPDDAFGSPVQEEANETAPFFQGGVGSGGGGTGPPRSRGDCTAHCAGSQDETLPVQEVMAERPPGK